MTTYTKVVVPNNGPTDYTTAGANTTFVTASGDIVNNGGAGDAIAVTGPGSATVTLTSTAVTTTTSSNYDSGVSSTAANLTLQVDAGSSITSNGTFVTSYGVLVNGGTLSLTNAGLITQTGSPGVGVQVMSSGPAFNGGTITNSGTLQGYVALNLGVNGVTVTNTGAIVGTKSSSPVAIDNRGANTLVLSNSGVQGTITGSLSLFSSGQTLSIDPGTASGSALTLSNTITGAGNLNKVGAGTLVLTGANTFSGVTFLTSGALNVGSANALGTSFFLSFSGGTLQYSAANTTDYSSRFSTNPSQAFSVDTNGQDVSYATTLSSSGGSLTKSGTGTLTLSAAPSTLRALTISGGTLALPGAYTPTVAASVSNLGALTSQAVALALSAGGTITNGDATHTTATIQSASTAISGSGSAAITLNNYGLIQGTSSAGAGQSSGNAGFTLNNMATGVVYGAGTYGVFQQVTGPLTVNNTGGMIVGANSGVYGNNAADTVTNSGTIASGSYTAGTGVTTGGSYGVLLNRGGAISNQATGSILSSGSCVASSGTSGLTLNNAGIIYGTGSGADVRIQESGAANDRILNSGSINSLFQYAISASCINATIVNTGRMSSTALAALNIASAGSGVSLYNGQSTGSNTGQILGGGSATNGYGVFQNGGARLTVFNYGAVGSSAATSSGISSNGGAVTASLFAGSNTGAISLANGADTVNLYTGESSAAAVTVADPTGGATPVSLRTAGAYNAAVFSTIALGGGANTLTLNGTGTGALAGSLNLANLTASGGSVSLAKNDAGTWTLTGDAVTNFSGATTVAAGTLLVDATTYRSAITAASGSTIGGTGTSTAGITVQAGATFAPGDATGTFTATTLTLSGTFAETITNGTTFGKAVGTAAGAGSIALSGALTLNYTGGTEANGTVYTVISETGGGTITGTFNNANNQVISNGRTFAIGYTPNTVTLTDITVPPAAPATGGTTATAASTPSLAAALPTQASNVLRLDPNSADANDPTSPLYAQLQAEHRIEAQYDAGRLFLQDAQLALFHIVDGTISLAETLYQFFTGKTPTAEGLNYLTHSVPNTNDLNDPYYAGFNIDNRYVNIAVGLGTGVGEGAAKFAADYGPLSITDAATKAYQAVFSVTPTAEKIAQILNDLVPNGRGGQETRLQYLADITGGTTIAQKAAILGFLMADSINEGLGTYQQANLHFLQDLAHGTAAYNVDLLTYYGPAPTLVGAPVADPTVPH